jgi:hypothetical protein
MPPLQPLLGEDTKKPPLPVLTQSRFYSLGFVGLFVDILLCAALILVVFLHAVLIDFIDHKESDATVRHCTRVLGLLLDQLFTTSRIKAYGFPCPFPPFPLPLSLSRCLGVGPALLRGGRQGGVR